LRTFLENAKRFDFCINLYSTHTFRFLEKEFFHRLFTVFQFLISHVGTALDSQDSQDLTISIGFLGQDTQERTKQIGQDNENMTTKIGQRWLKSWGRECQGRTATTGKPGKDRTVETGELGTRAVEQESWEKTLWKGQAYTGRAGQDKTARGDSQDSQILPGRKRPEG
jgi:hypothetical protein